MVNKDYQNLVYSES